MGGALGGGNGGMGGTGGGGIGTITTASVHDGGILHNGIGGTSGNTGPGARAGVGGLGGIGTGIIEVANIYGGILYNGDGGRGRGTIGAANVNGGTLANRAGSTIANATQNGGIINNSGRIDTMTYNAGTYNATANGTIGELTVAGDVRGDNWGTVESLVFASDAVGTVFFAALAPDMMGQTIVDISEVVFSGLRAGSVNVANGNIALDVTGLGSNFGETFTNLFGDEFAMASLFGATGVSGVSGLNSFQVSHGTEWVSIFDNGSFIDNTWSFTDTGFAWSGAWNDNWIDGSDNVVPAPATIVILALGLAGLGLARRRRK